MKVGVIMYLVASLFVIPKCVAQVQHGQMPPEGMLNALTLDDSVKLASFVTKDNVNDCYGNYSILSHSIRFGATKCFNFLIAEGADVNKVCNGYVPPLMHAAKYGRLEMAKVLVAKGADIHYKYEGNFAGAQGQTPLSYAELFQRKDVVEYLKHLN